MVDATQELFRKYKQLDGLPKQEYKKTLITLIDKFQRCSDLKQDNDREQLKEMYLKLKDKSNMTERFWINKFLAFLCKNKNKLDKDR